MASESASAAGRRRPDGPPGTRPSLRVAFVALKNPHYRSLWLSQVASFTGMQMQMVARGWLAFALTGNFTSVGLVMLSWGIPQLLFSLLGGALADRMNKRNLVIGGQVGIGALTLLTAVLVSLDMMTIPILFVLGLVQGTFFSVNMPARQALLAELVPQHQIMNAIALNNVAMNGTRILAPAIAGVLIAAWGVEAAFYAQAFMMLFVVLFLLRLPASKSHIAGASERGNVMQEIGVGLRYIASARTLMLLILMALVPTLLGMPYMSLLPGFAVDELGLQPGAYGMMFTVSGIGAIIGSVGIATLTESPHKALLQTIAGLGFGGSLLLLGLASAGFGYGGALVSLALLGLFSTTYMTLNNTMVMAETRPEFYGRVMSVYMLTHSVFPLMALPMGILADAITAKATFTILGAGIVLFMLMTAAASSKRVFRLADAPGPDSPPEASPARPIQPEGSAGGGGG